MNFRPLKLAVIAALALAVSACSGDDEDKAHVFKEKTQAIDKAREVEGILKDAAQKQKKAAEDSGN